MPLTAAQLAQIKADLAADQIYLSSLETQVFDTPLNPAAVKAWGAKVAFGLDVIQNDVDALVADSTPVIGLSLSAIPTESEIENAAITPIALAASGGTAPYAYAATGLPTGVGLSAAGVISGIPSVNGSFTVGVSVKDSSSPQESASETFVLTVAAPVPHASAPILGFGTIGDSVASAQALAKQIGVTALGSSVYTSGGSWSTIAGSGWAADGLASGETLLCAINLTPNNTGLSAVASNVGSFTTLAKSLPAGTICRFAEIDASWDAWGTGANGNTVAEFVSAVALVIPTMKAANPNLKFDLNFSAGLHTLTQLEAYYAGRGDLWDYIGADLYDQTGGGRDFSDMGAAVHLAAANGKPVSIPETGLNGVDSIAFIQDWAQVVLDPTVAATRYGWPTYTPGYSSYYSGDNGTINSTITNYPKSMAQIKTSFG